MLKCIAICPKGYDSCCFNCELKNLCNDSCTTTTKITDPEKCKLHVHTEELRREKREKRMDARFLRLYIIGAVAFLALLFTLMAVIGNQNAETIRDTDILNKLDVIDQAIEENRSEGQIEALGIFTITHYCPCEKCCGKSDGTTATGTTATEGRTIAVDPEVIPLGSQVEIGGQVYTAEDVGGAIKGNEVDVFVNSHSEALSRGKFTREVFTR
jgi:3D (Asp-Asp-Asp) domain-containing protein